MLTDSERGTVTFSTSCTRGVQTLSDLTHKTKQHVRMHSHTSKIIKKILRSKREKHKPMLRWMGRTHTYSDRAPTQVAHSESSKGHPDLRTHTTSLVTFAYQAR